MDPNALIAIIGSVVIGLVVRLSNVVVTWLSRVLGVDPPDPIPTPQDATPARPAKTTAAPPSTDVGATAPRDEP